MVKSDMVCPLVDRLTDRHDWKHYLPATSLAGGIGRRDKALFILTFLPAAKTLSTIHMTSCFWLMFQITVCKASAVIIFGRMQERIK